MKQKKKKTTSNIQNGINYIKKLNKIFLIFKDFNIEKLFLKSIHIQIAYLVILTFYYKNCNIDDIFYFQGHRMFRNAIILSLQLLILFIEIVFQQNKNYIVIIIGCSSFILIVNFIIRHYVFQILMGVVSQILFSYYAIQSASDNLLTQEQTHNGIPDPKNENMTQCFSFDESYHRLLIIGQIFGMFEMFTNDNFIIDFIQNTISQLMVLIIFPQSGDLVILNICVYFCLVFCKYFLNLERRTSFLKYQYLLKYIDSFQNALPFKIILTHYDQIQNSISPLNINQSSAFKNGIFDDQQKFYEYLSNHYISKEQSDIHFETQKKGQLDLKSYLLERFYNIEKNKNKISRRSTYQKQLRKDSIFTEFDETKKTDNFTKVDTLYTHCYDKINELDFQSRNESVSNNEQFLKPTKECIVRVSLLQLDIPYLVVIFFDNVDSKITQNLKDQIDKKNKFIDEYSNVVSDKQQFIQSNQSKFNLQLTVQLLLNNLFSFNFHQIQRNEGKLKVCVEKFEISTLISYLKKLFKHKIRVNCNDTTFQLFSDYQCLKFICTSLCSSLIDSPLQYQNISSFSINKICILTITVVKYKLYATLQFNIKSEIQEQKYPVDYSDQLKIPQQRSFYDCLQTSNKNFIFRNQSTSSQTPLNNIPQKSAADENSIYKRRVSIATPYSSISYQNDTFELKKQNILKNNQTGQNQSQSIIKVNFSKEHTSKKNNPSNSQLNKSQIPQYEDELQSVKNQANKHNTKETYDQRSFSPNQIRNLSSILKNSGFQQNNNSVSVNQSFDSRQANFQKLIPKICLQPTISVNNKIVNEVISNAKEGNEEEFKSNDSEFENLSIKKYINKEKSLRINENNNSINKTQYVNEEIQSMNDKVKLDLNQENTKNICEDDVNRQNQIDIKSENQEIQNIIDNKINNIHIQNLVENNNTEMTNEIQVYQANDKKKEQDFQQQFLQTNFKNEIQIHSYQSEPISIPDSPQRLRQKTFNEQVNVNFNSSQLYSQIEFNMIKQIVKKIGINDLKVVDNVFDFEILSDLSSVVQSPKKSQINNDYQFNNSLSPQDQNSYKIKHSNICTSLLSENSLPCRSKLMNEIPKVKSILSSKRIASQQNTSHAETLANFEEESRDYSSQQESIRINEHPFGPDINEGIGVFLQQFNFEKLKNQNNVNKNNQFYQNRYIQTVQFI